MFALTAPDANSDAPTAPAAIKSAVIAFVPIITLALTAPFAIACLVITP